MKQNKMKKLKLYFMGTRMKDIYPYATRWEVIKYKTAKFVVKWTKILGFTAIVVVVTMILIPEKLEVRQVVVKEEANYIVLDKIAKCESGGTHFAKNGQVITHGNTDASSDIGKYMINDKIWGAKATEMGLNLWVENDNRLFAEYLFKTYGSEPWYLTKSCWRK